MRGESDVFDAVGLSEEGGDAGWILAVGAWWGWWRDVGNTSEWGIKRPGYFLHGFHYFFKTKGTALHQPILLRHPFSEEGDACELLVLGRETEEGEDGSDEGLAVGEAGGGGEDVG